MKHFLSTIVALVLVASSHPAMAAITASMSSSQNPAIINQQVPLVLSIVNGGSSAATLTGVQITANYNGVPGGKIPAAFSQFAYPPSNQLSVAGSNATTSVPFSAVFFAPSTGVTGSGTGVYYIGATLSFSDGSSVGVSSAAQQTVNPVPLPAYERL